MIDLDTVKARLRELQSAYKADLQGKFDLSVGGEITLLAPLPLANLVHFFEAVFGLEDEIPPVDLAGATITAFHVVKGTDDMPPQADIGLTFASATWDVMDGLSLDLDALRIKCFGGNWSGTVRAAATVQGHPFHVSLRWPEFIIYGYVETPGTRKAGSLADAHAFKAGAGASLDRLAIYAAPRIHYLQLDVGGSNLMQFGALTLKKADLRIVYAGGIKSSFTGKAHSLVTIGKYDFDLSAERTETGWKAKAAAVTAGRLEDVVADVAGAMAGTRHKLSDYGVPVALAHAAIKGTVTAEIDTAKSHIALTATVDVRKGEARFEIDLTEKGLAAKATLTLGDMTFEADFTNASNPALMAAQFVSEKGVSLGLSDLVDLSHLGPVGTPTAVNAAFRITLRDALIAAAQPKGKSAKYLVAADIEGGIDLSGLGSLPVIGDMLPSDVGLALSLAPVINHGAWDAAEIKALNRLRGSAGPHLPDTVSKPGLGISLRTPGHAPDPVDLALTSDPASSKDLVEAKPAASDTVKWKSIQRKLGPLSINRVGVGLDRSNAADTQVTALIDGGVAMLGLDLSLIGLGGRYGLSSKTLHFELKGLGLEVDKPPLKIGGAFANLDGDYVGKVMLALKTFSLSASGAFKMLDGTPSMFIYGVLNTPLGGPAFFFVEGLAAGFGYNRALSQPKLSEVRAFPFVADAIGAAAAAPGKAKKPGKMGDELQRLHSFVQPKLGQNFVAAGIKFTSFKLLDSFVLLMVSFGRELEIDVLGISTYQTPPIVPKGVPALARVELNLAAAFKPSAGSLMVQAELGKNSYVYASLCHLGGGFAFGSWFGPDHAGDFVLSAGGYHPDFAKPDHYPDVSRISLTFQVTPKIYIKGSAYFALTPSMFMAGGSLSAHAKFGKVSASFRMGIDFLISWEPYHYDARATLDIRASWWAFSTHAHAALHVWGPSFAGHAEVNWSVISFDVDFGHISYTSLMMGQLPISWNKFQQSFLPSAKAGHLPAGQVSNVDPGITVAAGQVGEVATGAGKPPIAVINPKELSVRIDSVIPILTNGTHAMPGSGKVGCAPLNQPAITSSDIALTITGASGTDQSAQFKVLRAAKSFPAAMWGPSLKPDPRADTQITAGGVLSLGPAKAPDMPQAETIRRKEASYDRKVLSAAPKPRAARYRNGSGTFADALMPAAGTAARAARDAMLAEVGLSPQTATLRPEIAETFRATPIVLGVS